MSIEDDAPGLPVDSRDRFLGRHRAHPQSGVRIVRSLVERFGGDVDIVVEKEGTEVTVTLPAP